MARQKPASSLFHRFLSNEAAGGIVLIAAAALALVVANSPLAASYFHLLHAHTGPTLAPQIGPMSVHLWINDGLMAVFFLLVGLEIKRELVGGELSAPEKRRLPVIAAVAGMALPALLFLAVTGGAPAVRSGWAIPAATDIAFALGVLALAGPRVPASLKLFLTTVAIVDDLGAVAIIALFYTDTIAPVPLFCAAVMTVALVAANRMGRKGLGFYMVGFAGLWLLLLQSGVHATIAGVVTAAVIPAKGRNAPLHRLEHALSPWVAFVIVPLFGFANAGVALGGTRLATLAQPLVLGIALALFLGKQIGIFGAVRGAVALGLAQPPDGASWRQIYGVALLCGIGFTMSLFIGGLAFAGNEAMVDQVKIGVLLGSLGSALSGFALLRTAR